MKQLKHPNHKLRAIWRWNAAVGKRNEAAVARARGMTQIAKDVGLGRESLYKALSGDNNPSFATMLKVMSALGVKLQVVAT